MANPQSTALTTRRTCTVPSSVTRTSATWALQLSPGQQAMPRPQPFGNGSPQPEPFAANSKTACSRATSGVLAVSKSKRNCSASRPRAYASSSIKHSFANTVYDDATDLHQERGTTDSAGE